MTTAPHSIRLSRRLRHTLLTLALSLVATLLTWPAAQPAMASHGSSPVTTATFTNAGFIDIPDWGKASPYPASVQVSGLSGLVTKATVSLHALAHHWPRDLEILLQGPQGQWALLYDSTGPTSAVSNVHLTFDTAATQYLGYYGLSSGTYRPWVGPGLWSFPSPGPGIIRRTGSLDDFVGTAPNGTWNLFVFDTSMNKLGRIEQGWSLHLTTDGQSALVPVSPTRVFDTRPTAPHGAVVVPKQAITGGTQLKVQVTGVAGIPGTLVDAVSLNVTVTGASKPGFLTVYPCGGQRPLASNLNYVGGQTVPNSVITPVSQTGHVCFYAESTTHVLVDVNGYFRSQGTIRTMQPARIFDTRPTHPEAARFVPKVPLSPGQPLKVKVAGAAGLPGGGIAAASLNVTATGATATGHVSVHPCGAPPVSMVVHVAPGRTVPNAMIARLDPASGELCFTSTVPTHLVVDVNAWFAPDTGFGALVPTRLADTRPQHPQGATTVTKAMVPAGAVLRIQATGRGGVPATGVGALAVNLTVIGGTSAGYVTVYGCSSSPPLASNVNVRPGQTVSNGAITPVDPSSGEICIYAARAVHVVLDVTGWFRDR